MSRDNFIIYTAMVILVALIGIELYVKTELSASSSELAIIHKKLIDEKAKNGELYEQYLDAQSLRIILVKAKQAGFGPAEIIYLK